MEKTDNYFLGNSLLSDSEREKLISANLATSFHIEESGLLILGKDLSKALSVLKKRVAAIKSSYYENIMILEIAEYESFSGDGTGLINIKTWDGALSSKRFTEIIQDNLSPFLLKRDIDVFVPHNKTQMWNRDNKNFQIYIWSSYVDKKSITTPEKIFGITVDCKDPAFSPGNKGIVIKDGYYAVAELIDNRALYIHHDLIHENTYNAEILSAEILRLAGERLSLSKDEREFALQIIRERDFKRFVEVCQNRQISTLKDLEKELSEAEESITKHREGLVESIRNRDWTLKQLEFERNHNLEDAEHIIKEYEALLSIPKIKRLRMKGTSLEVFTNILYCEDPRTNLVHEIGEFKITIPIDGDGSILWHNLSRQVDAHSAGQMAPHIWSSGKACEGNMEETFIELISRYEISVLAMLAIEFVESVNTSDSAGQHINKWPVASK